MEGQIHPRPPALGPGRSSPSAHQLREQILFARVGASRVNRAPVELDRCEHVERFRIGGCGPVHMHLPMADGILEIDHLDAAVGPSEEKALLAKRTFELVTKLRVTHDHASWEIGYGSISSMTRGES